MLRMVFLVAIAIALCSSCAQPEYWVAGLTLPPGSTVVNQTESKTSTGTPGMSMPLMGEIDKTLVVSFNCSAGWDSVSRHISGCLTGKGFTDEMSSMTDMMGGSPEAAEAAKIFDFMKMYSNSDKKVVVTLSSMEGIMSAAGGAGGADMSTLGMGEYTLTVMKTK